MAPPSGAIAECTTPFCWGIPGPDLATTKTLPKSAFRQSTPIAYRLWSCCISPQSGRVAWNPAISIVITFSGSTRLSSMGRRSTSLSPRACSSSCGARAFSQKSRRNRSFPTPCAYFSRIVAEQCSSICTFPPSAGLKHSAGPKPGQSKGSCSAALPSPLLQQRQALPPFAGCSAGMLSLKSNSESHATNDTPRFRGTRDSFRSSVHRPNDLHRPRR